MSNHVEVVTWFNVLIRETTIGLETCHMIEQQNHIHGHGREGPQ